MEDEFLLMYVDTIELHAGEKKEEEEQQRKTISIYTRPVCSESSSQANPN